MSLARFENVRDQIGYCGAWCGSCVVGNGVLQELTRMYQDMINAYGLREWGPKDIDYDKFAEALQSIQTMPGCSGCRQGDGRPDCELRACAKGKGIQTCFECDTADQCSHPDVLRSMQDGARAAGIFFKDDLPDSTDPIGDWTAEISAKWPCSILFEDRG